jgi:dipeptidyl aminopeptidase/acylaminoacyl peptidase
MSRPFRVEDLARTVLPSQPALTPDGSRLVYVVRGHDREADQAVTALWVIEGDAAPRQLTDGTSDGLPAWSPDGSTLAFVRDGQLWLLPAGGEPTQLTSLPMGAGEPRWSPDGTRIAFSAPVDADAVEGEDDAARARRANAPIVAGGIEYQLDGMGYVRSVRMQVHVVDVASGAVRQVTTGRQHAVNPAWSPDGTTLVYLAKREETSDLDLEMAVHVLDVTAEDAAPRLVAFAGGYVASARFTPDGRRLVAAGYRGAVRGHARLWVVDVASGAVVELAGELDRNVMPGAPAYPGAYPVVGPDGETVYFCVRDRGCTHLYAVPLAGGAATPVIAEPGLIVSGLSLAGETAAVALATAASFGEIVTLDLATGKRTVRTDHGASLGDVAIAPRVAREFTIGDGTVVEAWLMRAEQTTGPSPLLVDVHGGPHNAWNGAADEAHPYHYELVARGWTVLLVNPRGSDGYGEAFYEGVFGAWGTADARDFLDPVDVLVAEGVADPARLALTGYSYGGYMTGYLTSRDDRFAAAVAGGMLSDLVSAGGTSDNSHNLSVFELGMLSWERPDELAAMSPITRIADVAVPTLVLHGANDLTCPVGQAQQWYYALRERGVETELVLYPGGGHLFLLNGPPSHRIDYSRRVVDWVERFAGTLSPGRSR